MRAALAAVFVSSAVFVAGAFALSRLAGFLSFPCLAVLLGYSLTKRITWLSHAVLGLALGLAPLGAWVAGFDLIYACQDTEIDRALGLRSFPARFGVARALVASALLHVGTVALLAVFAWRSELGPGFWATLALAAALLVWQHRIVAPNDLSRVDLAFFTLNGWVGVGLFLGCAFDVVRAGGVA